MASDGIFWFGNKDPLVYAKQFSAAAARLDVQVPAVVSRVVDRAAETMRARIRTGGVLNRQYTGGPRILTGAMYNSVDARMVVNRRGRAQGAYGYLNDPPYWTIFQEEGTRSGILPLHALTMAHEEAARTLATDISNINIWGGIR